MFNFSDVSSNNFTSKRSPFFTIFVPLDSLTKLLWVGMKISRFDLKHCFKIALDHNNIMINPKHDHSTFKTKYLLDFST